MKIDRKLLVPIAMLAVISVGGAYAFLSLTVTTTVHISEPLSIVSVVGTGDLAGLTCNSLAALTATCSVALSAGAIGGVVVTVNNAGSQALVVTPGGNSDNADVILGNPSSASISSNASLEFAYSVTVSPSAIAPGTATLTLTFGR